METNWVRIYNMLFEIVNHGETNYSGPKFIVVVREVDPYFPEYNQFMAKKREEGDTRTSRKQYFYDILMGFKPVERVKIINRILDSTENVHPEKVSVLRSELRGDAEAPTARVSFEVWNADRLNKYLSEIDDSISSRNYERAVSLSYTCLEGFYKAFVKAKVADGEKAKQEILALSRAIQTYLKQVVKEYPDEAITMVNHISHTVDKARNGFSESHFGEETGAWLAVYIRDLVNSQIRLLLHFF
jgi:hypothetical protein